MGGGALPWSLQVVEAGLLTHLAKDGAGDTGGHVLLRLMDDSFGQLATPQHATLALVNQKVLGLNLRRSWTVMLMVRQPLIDGSDAAKYGDKRENKKLASC